VGTLLLTALLHRADDLDISLSVEHGNHRARRLYERLGFVTVAEDTTARTMLRSAAVRR
jgi:ribosomal protein S18 acetylase RimI-like enzyme